MNFNVIRLTYTKLLMLRFRSWNKYVVFVSTSFVTVFQELKVFVLIFGVYNKQNSIKYSKVYFFEIYNIFANKCSSLLANIEPKFFPVHNLTNYILCIFLKSSITVNQAFFYSLSCAYLCSCCIPQLLVSIDLTHALEVVCLSGWNWGAIRRRIMNNVAYATTGLGKEEQIDRTKKCVNYFIELIHPEW